MTRLAARLFSVWGTDLPRPVLILQGGSALSAFGYGLILPFEIIYLHQARGFGVATSGLVLATVQAAAVVSAPPVGALLDRFHAKPVLIASVIASAVGYGGMAFIDSPWQAFLLSAIAGLGFGASSAAAPTLIMSLVTPEQRASSFALSRVAANVGIGGGATVAGFILAASQRLGSFQTLYLIDAASYLALSLLIVLAVPNVRAATPIEEKPARASYRAVATDKLFMTLLFVNVVLTIVGYSLFGNILGPYIKNHTAIGPGTIGVLFLVNTVFIVIAQLPAARVVKRIRRMQALAAMCALWAVACVGVLAAAALGSALGATVVLVGVAIAFAVGECVHFIVLGPIAVDLAPPQMLGRYMSLYSLTFSAGLSLGPALGGALLAVSPDAVWWAGAIAVTAVGVGLLRFGDRIPDPLVAPKADGSISLSMQASGRASEET
jgi:MFS family permease